MKNRTIITGIDIGTTKVVAVIAEVVFEEKVLEYWQQKMLQKIISKHYF